MRKTVVTLISVLVPAVMLLGIGCGGGANTTAPVTPPITSPGTAPAMSVYLYQDNDAFAPPGPSTILQFAKTAAGSVTALSTITGPANVIFQTLVEDPAGNLYVGANTYNAAPNSGPGTVDILEYAAASSGTAAPLRAISGTSTGLQILANNPIYGMDLDSSGNLYVAADVAIGTGAAGRVFAGISVFAPSANGNVAPTKVIAGDQTTMVAGPSQIAVTPAGAFYVANATIQGPGTILLFPATATGNVAPTGVLGGANTLIYTVKGVALDAAGNLYVSSQGQPTSVSADSAVASILVFAAGATGNVAPIRVITGSATTMHFIGNLRVDSVGDIFILSGATLLKFAPSATGNVAPASSITSTAYFQPQGSVAVQ